jgi:hypothetical protein
MYGMGNNEDDERFWNFVMFKFYGTDKELDEVAPVFGIILLLCIIGGLIWWAVS